MKEIVLNEADNAINNTFDDVVINSHYTVLENFAKILSYDAGSPITFMEAAALDSMHYEVLNNHNRVTTSNFDKDLPKITPYFTPTEYKDIFPDGEISDFDYMILQDPALYGRVLERTYQLMSLTHDEEKIQQCQDKLTKLGWLPQVEPNATNMKYARSRQLKWLKENKPVIKLIDIRNFNGVESVEETSSTKLAPVSILEPIYICLSYTGTIFGDIINWWKKSKYSHSALSLDEKLDKMFSFNRDVKTGESGFFIEGIQDYKNPKMNNDANLLVLAVMVTSEQKKKIKETLDWYIKNKKFTSYSFKNIANIVFNKTAESVYSLSMVCSQFVDNILKIANVDITRKPNNLVSPQDFAYTASEQNKVYVVYEGLKSKYDPKKIKTKVNSLITYLTRKEVRKIAANEVSIMMKNPTIESFLVECIDDADKQQILSEAIDILTPTSILEAKRIPVGFTYKGDIYIDIKKDLESEYQEAHKLLGVYDETNIQGIKHELARLFYIISIIDRRVGKIDDKSSVEYKDLIKLKARAMNDFTKYMKIVNRVEKNFDFSEYLKHTEYYDKTMIIGNDTLKYSGSFIKKALKLLGI